MFISPELYEDAVRELDTYAPATSLTSGTTATARATATATTSLRSSVTRSPQELTSSSVATTLLLEQPVTNSPQPYRGGVGSCGGVGGDPDSSMTQSQGITVPSSPSTSTLRPTASTQSLRPRFLFSDPLQAQSESLTHGGAGGGAVLERTGSSSHISPKMRALAQASSHVIQHVVQVGSCGDPRCLMFFDPDVFTAPLTLASRQRMASFRRYPSASGLVGGGGGKSTSSKPHHPGSQPSEDKGPTASTATSDEDEELDDAPFDTQKVGRRLFSSAAQQSVPLHEYVLQALSALSASQSPIRCSPETFVFALVLLERVQHTSLLSSSSAVAPQHQHPAASLVEPLIHLLSPITPNPAAISCAPAAVAPTSAAAGLSAATAAATAAPEDRIRSFLDETPAVQRLTSENLQALHANSRGPSRSATPALTVGQRTSDTESLGLDRGDDRTSLSGAGGEPRHVVSSLCADCLEHPGLALHASNVHLFFAAAVLVALKVREDVFAGSRILALVASTMSCPSSRSLLLAERCLCHLLDFNVNVTPSEYRQMLRQLHANRNGTSSGGGWGGGRVSPGSTLPTEGGGDGHVAVNFMSLFAPA